MSRRPPATLADYVLVGVNPALIMFLIGSLVFFLLEVFYRDVYEMRLNFIFAMFIMGTVAVGRISMEEGVGYATMFGAPLAIVTLFAISQFVQFGGALGPYSIFINVGLIALIWWLAYQLTWDCTLLDEQADTSDQGLLQAVGLQNEAVDESNIAEDPLDPEPADKADEPHEESPAWMKWLERSKQPHAHGVWVIYFSLAALPLFGLGQWFLPAPSREYAFGLLVIYVATALALLLSTSFLGLRRYLRKRRLEMPLEMTTVWLTVGCLIIIAVLTVSLLIPRPGAEVAVSQLPPITITTGDLSPSRWGWGKEGEKQNPNAAATAEPEEKSQEQQEGKPSEGQSSSGKPSAGKGDPNAQSGNASPSSDQQSAGGGSPQGSQTSSGSQSDQSSSSSGQSDQGGDAAKGQQPPSEGKSSQSGGEQNKQASQQTQSPNGQKSQGGGASNQSQQTTAQQPSSTSQTRSTTSSSPLRLLPSLDSLMKLILYALVLGILLFLAYKYRRQLVAAWRQLLKELREFWERFFRRSGEATPSTDSAVLPPVRHPFAAFSDPFMSGRAQRISRIELIRYTFEALQAWGREHGCPRQESETPHEYVQRLSTTAPHLAAEARALAEFYGLAAYAKAMLPASIGEPLRTLWFKMGQVGRAPLPAVQELV